MSANARPSNVARVKRLNSPLHPAINPGGSHCLVRRSREISHREVVNEKRLLDTTAKSRARLKNRRRRDVRGTTGE